MKPCHLAALTALALFGAAAAPSSSALAQANLSFSGGSGAPLTLTLSGDVSYTITGTVAPGNGPIIAFDGVGDFTANSFLSVAGDLTFSVNGGGPLTLDTLRSGFQGGSITADDAYLFSLSSLPGLAIGDVVVLSSGFLTTTANFSNPAPAGGNFGSYLTDGNGNSVAVAAVPEPSTWALALGGLGVLGLVQGRRRRLTA